MQKFKCQNHLTDSSQLEGTLSSAIRIRRVSNMVVDTCDIVDKKQLQEKNKIK